MAVALWISISGTSHFRRYLGRFPDPNGFETTSTGKRGNFFGYKVHEGILETHYKSAAEAIEASYRSSAQATTNQQ